MTIPANDEMSLFTQAIRDGLKVREGEVLTETVIEERVGSLTMAIWAQLPTVHHIRVRKVPSEVKSEGEHNLKPSLPWQATSNTMLSPGGAMCVGFGWTARGALADFFYKNLNWRDELEIVNGRQLFEVHVEVKNG